MKGAGSTGTTGSVCVWGGCNTPKEKSRKVPNFPREGPEMLELWNVLNTKEYCERLWSKKLWKKVFLTPYYPKKCLEKFFGTFYFRKKTLTFPLLPQTFSGNIFLGGGGGRKEGGPNLFLKKDKLFLLNLLRTSLLIPNPFLLAGAAYDRLKIATRTYRIKYWIIISAIWMHNTHRSFSLTWSVAPVGWWNNTKYLNKKELIPVPYTNMATISLFWYTNMAAVTSDENDL